MTMGDSFGESGEARSFRAESVTNGKRLALKPGARILNRLSRSPVSLSYL